MATHEDPKFEDEHGKLLRLAHNPNVNIPSVTALNLSNSKYCTVPPSLTLINFVNLRVISLSHNRIERFIAENLVLGAPLLEELDLSYNDIKTLDDIVELGSLQHLGIFTFQENPICKRYLRIKLIELLLFPSKYQVYDPVKLLTASYNIGLSKERTEKWRSLTNKNLVLRPRSGSLDKRDAQKRISKGISSNDLLRLTEEKCPVPRKTRFPELVTLNGEIISVSDMQSILATQNLASILPDGEVVKKVEKPARFEKLHEKYIHSYAKKKERMKDDMNQIPTLQRIATIVGDDESGLKLMSYADHMRYGKRKTAKQDYEEQLWKMSGANKGIDDEFIIETIESDEEDIDESVHKTISPKGAKAKVKKNKEHRTRKALRKKRWNRKDSEDEIQPEEESASSDSNLSERVSPGRKRMNQVEAPVEVSKEEEMCLLDLQEEKPNTSGDSLLEESMHQRHERRSHSVTKFNKEKTQAKRVGFNPGSTVRDNKEDSPGSREVKLFGFRRAQTVAMRDNNNNNEEQRSFSEFSPRMRNTTRQETTQSEQEKPGKTYVVMRASTPNLSLARTKSVNIRMQYPDREITSNKPPLSGQIIDIKKQKVSIPNQEQSDSSPEFSKDANQHRRTLTTEQISSTREESSGKHHYHKSMSSRTESHSVSKNKTHLFLQKVDGPGFESIDEIKEIEQSGHNPISSISKASFLTPIKKFSQKTSFQQQSINGDFSSVATFPELSPKYAERSPSKDINEILKVSEPDSKQNHDDVASSTITNPLKYASRETQELKKSPVKAEKFHISDGKTYLKLLVAKKKAQKVKDHDRESRKLSQVIFLNRANATSYVKKQQEKRSSSISGMIQQQMQRQNLNLNQQSQHILIQQQQPQSQAQVQLTQQSHQKASDIINSQYTQENQIMFQKLFTQIVAQQKSFYSKFPGQNTDRPSFYFPKTQTSYVNTSNRFVISRSQQEQSSDLRSPEKTRLRTEEDGQGNASLSMTKRLTSSFMSRQSGQGKAKTKSVDRKEVAFSYGEVLDRGGKYGKLVKV